MKTFDATKANEIFEEEKRQAASGVVYAALSNAQNRINHLPDAGAAPVRRGYWIMRGVVPECSECRTVAPMKEVRGGWRCYHRAKFCYECGVAMTNYDR